MADPGKARLVSGEIMAGPKAGGSVGVDRAIGDGDIVDAQFETVAGSGPRDDMPAAPSIGSLAAPALGMDMLRKGEAPRSGRVRGGPLFWISGIGLAAAAFWVSGGHALLRDFPLTLERAQAGALRISGVRSRVDQSGGRPMLFVDGEAANDGPAAELLPPLEIVVAAADGSTTRYRLGTNGRRLAPGETFAFSSRLDAPKSGVKTVSVMFGE